jgi:hypothetical protein
MKRHPKFRVGNIVEVCSKEEILRTLDKNGQLDGMPFMPQMFQYCGRRLRVAKRAHKTCDTINEFKGRRLKDAVHLEESRCDGQVYGGCQAGCWMFWKTAWLKEPSDTNVDRSPAPLTEVGGAGLCTEADVLAGTQRPSKGNGPVYVCQATQVLAATEPLPWWSLGQYLEDFTSGNMSLWKLLRGFIYMGYRALINLGIGLGKPLRWLYDAVQKLWGGVPYPRKPGTIPKGKPTPAIDLQLQAGDLVRVKSHQAILNTIDETNRNRGLYFDAEMVPYCGKTRRVLTRVTRIVNEKTGEIQEFKTPCIILEGAVCESRYSECRLFCPRSIYAYWREIWLEKVPEGESK